MKRLIPLLILTFIIIFFFSGCVTTIAKIAEDPQEYSGKKIVLSGTIDLAVTIPFTRLYIFTFTDSTGSVVVFSEKKHVKGESLKLTGSVVSFPGEGLKSESKKSAVWLKDFLIENDLVSKEIAQGVADVIIKTCKGIAGGLEKIFFIKEE